MDSSREIEPPSGGEESGSKGKEIGNTAEGEMDSSKQQATCKEENDSNKQESSKTSDPNWQKKDNMAEDSRNPTFVVIDQPKTTKRVSIYFIEYVHMRISQMFFHFANL